MKKQKYLKRTTKIITPMMEQQKIDNIGGFFSRRKILKIYFKIKAVFNILVTLFSVYMYSVYILLPLATSDTGLVGRAGATGIMAFAFYKIFIKYFSLSILCNPKELYKEWLIRNILILNLNIKMIDEKTYFSLINQSTAELERKLEEKLKKKRRERG